MDREKQDGVLIAPAFAVGLFGGRRDSEASDRPDFLETAVGFVETALTLDRCGAGASASQPKKRRYGSVNSIKQRW